MRHCSRTLWTTVIVAAAVLLGSVEAAKHFSAVPGCRGGTASCAPSGWRAVSRAAPAEPLPLVFALKQRNIDKLMQLVDRVSDPGSPMRGRYLTLGELHALTGDPKAAAGLVTWLHSNGFTAVAPHYHAGFVTAQHSIGRLQELFGARLLKFQRSSDDNVARQQSLVRTTEYSLPDVIEPFVDFIYGLIDFPPPSTIRPIVVAFDDDNDTKASPQIEVEEITPTLLNAYYRIGGADTIEDSRATQSLFEALEQNYSPKDLEIFQERFGLRRNAIARVVGKNDPDMCDTSPRHCAEGQLDVDYITAIAQDSPTTYWSVEGLGADIFLRWIIAVGEDADPPLVHSVSYGGPERLFPIELVRRVDVEFAKLAARGITVVVASGDDGVAGSQARSNSMMCRYNPSYPASLPHVVSVGATQGPEANKSEIACSSETSGLITSGGGFSTVFDMPNFQATAVKSFFERSDPKAVKGYNADGRGFPDVSAAGRNYAVAIGGRWYSISGTSASAPVVAAMFTLINGMRMRQGKPALGWVTPALYSLGINSPAFRDIVEGRNNCCAARQSPVCCEEGFTATSGWDPVTGLGSIDFRNLAKALVNL